MSILHKAGLALVVLGALGQPISAHAMAGITVSPPTVTGGGGSPFIYSYDVTPTTFDASQFDFTFSDPNVTFASVTGPLDVVTATGPGSFTNTSSTGATLAAGSSETVTFTSPDGLNGGNFVASGTGPNGGGASFRVPGPSPFSDQNLVQNGDFETGDFTGFSVSGSNTRVDSGAGIGGSYAASFGDINPNIGILSQDLLTTVGQQYFLTFFAQTPEFGITSPGDTGQPNVLLVTFGGRPVSAFSVPDADGFTQYSYTVTATSSISTLAFYLSNNPDYTQLDNISVTPVPEASTTVSFGLLLALGLGGVLVAARKKRAA